MGRRSLRESSSFDRVVLDSVIMFCFTVVPRMAGTRPVWPTKASTFRRGIVLLPRVGPESMMFFRGLLGACWRQIVRAQNKKRSPATASFVFLKVSSLSLSVNPISMAASSSSIATLSSISLLRLTSRLAFSVPVPFSSPATLATRPKVPESPCP